MQDMTERKTVAKEDMIRNILDAYARGEDGALCMNVLAPLVEWLLEDHSWLQIALHEGNPDEPEYEMF
jgi:hypothetical protein